MGTPYYFRVGETTKEKAVDDGAIPILPGRCLICDTGEIYYDSKDMVRRRIANASSTGDATLSRSGWADKKQTVSISGVKPDSNGVIGVAQSISAGALSAVESAQLFIVDQGDGTITVGCAKDVPTVDIPISVILFS